MKTNTNTYTTMNTTEPSSKPVVETEAPPSLPELLQPLVAFLNAECPSPIDGYYCAPFGKFGAVEVPEQEVLIDLNVEGLTEAAKRIVIAILRRTGSNCMWCSNRPSEGDLEDPCKTPLRFALTTQTFHMECDWYWDLHLRVDHCEPDLDHEAAARQITALIEFLRDKSNIAELSAGEQAFFRRA